MNEKDFDSLGYEYLRSYQNMSNLYYKLLALNYQRDFCSKYKCPPIHKYYFSLPNDNSSEQQFIYNCLCAWLIKDVCQMNLELEPEEYEDPDITIGVIIEALKLLLMVDDYDNKNMMNKSAKNFINFPVGRLKAGYGPEVIWTLNIFADRGLELMLATDLESGENKRIQIVYHNKNNLIHDNNNKQLVNNSNTNNFITIGQPFVGGGLTTRPLGSYQIDDKTLLLDDDEDNDDEHGEEGNNENEINTSNNLCISNVEPDKWYQQVQRLEKALEFDTINSYHDYGLNQLNKMTILADNNWPSLLKTFSSCKRSLQDFLNQSQSILEAITIRINRHLQVINGRESFIRTNLKSEFNEILNVWRTYTIELDHNNKLMEQVTQKTDMFDSYTDRVKHCNSLIESRVKELNDGSKLRQLETMINGLNAEMVDFDLKIGLLLTLYSKAHKRILNS